MSNKIPAGRSEIDANGIYPSQDTNMSQSQVQTNKHALINHFFTKKGKSVLYGPKK